VSYPTHWWLPEDNADLVVNPGDPSLVLDASDLDKFERAVGIEGIVFPYNSQAVQYLNLNRFEDGAGVEEGNGVEASGEMPETSTYLGGEPLTPIMRGDSFNEFYISRAWGPYLRGWIGGQSLGFDPTLRVKWGDADIRFLAQARGSYDGAFAALVSPFNQAAAREWAALHGKAASDLGFWKYHFASVDDPNGWAGLPAAAHVSIPWDGVTSGEARLVFSGTPTAATVTAQYHNGSTWIAISSVGPIDLTTIFQTLPAPIGSNWQQAGMVARLFAGATEVFGSGADVLVHWFNEVEVDRFEPWIINRLATRNRQAYDGDLGEDGDLFFPAADLIHVPIGSNFGAPVSLRVVDVAWNSVVEVDEWSVVSSVPSGSTVLIENTTISPRPLLRADGAWKGIGEPFAIVGRFGLQDLFYFQGLAFGFQYCQLITMGGTFLVGDPQVDNGFALYWDAKTEELVATIYSLGSASFVEARAPFAPGDYDGKQLELGIAWTGDEGAAAGFDDRTLRVVVDGVTLATLKVDDAEIARNATDAISFGPATHAAYFPMRQGYRGTFGGAVIYQEPMTDEALGAAFSPEEIPTPFENPSFEIEATSGRVGEAEAWEWISQQVAAAWAEFTAYVERLRAPWEDWDHLGTRAIKIGSNAEPFDFSSAKAFGVTIDGVGQLVTIDPAVATFEDPANATAAEVCAALNDLIEGGDAFPWLGEFVAVRSSSDGEGSTLSVDIAQAAAVVLGFTDATTSQGANDVGWSELLTDFSNVTTGEFTGGSETFEGFEVWGDEFHVPPNWIGEPWREAFTYTPGGFTSSVDQGAPWSHDWTRAFEGFVEGWENDVLPMLTTPYTADALTPGTAGDGRLYSSALTFPLGVGATRNRLTLGWGTIAPVAGFRVLELPITAGSYASASALVAELQSALVAALSGDTSGLTFGTWESEDGEQEGIWLGWDGSTSSISEFAILSTPRSDRLYFDQDARETLGLIGIGPNGSRSELKIPADAWDSGSTGPYDPSGSYYLAEQWGLVIYEVVNDPVSGLFALPYNWGAAEFDTSIGSGTYVDRVTLKGWTNDASAVWKDELTDYSTTTAEFDHVPPNDAPAPPAPGYRLAETFTEDKWLGEVF